MSRTTLDLSVGFFVVIGLVALLFLSLRVSSQAGVGSRKMYHLQAQFDDIGGLKPRAPVKSAGVLVGRVSEISLNPDNYRANVSLSLDTAYTFPSDTIASILTSGVLGEQYIGLDAGGDEEMLEDGDQIDMTQSAVVIEKLIGQFMFGRASKPESAPEGQK